jgi:hypothetical protein
MNKRQLMSRVLIVGLLALLILARYHAADAQIVTRETLTPRVTVQDQALADDQVTVAEVVAPQAGWIVIHRNQDGNVGALIGLAPVHTGVNTNVTVKINRALATETLYALLHLDAGQRGVYEFPGADAPVIVSNPPLLVFHITGLPPTTVKKPRVAPEQALMAEEAAEHPLRVNEPVWLTTSATEARLRGQGEPGAALHVLIDDTVVSTTTIGTSGTWTLTLTLDRPAAHTIGVQDVASAAPASAAQAEPVKQPFSLYLPLILRRPALQGRITQSANLRAGPSLSFPIIGKARARQSVILVACNQTCTWYQLASGAWIAAVLVQGVADLRQTLPLATPPESSK